MNVIFGIYRVSTLIKVCLWRHLNSTYAKLSFLSFLSKKCLRTRRPSKNEKINYFSKPEVGFKNKRNSNNLFKMLSVLKISWKSIEPFQRNLLYKIRKKTPLKTKDLNKKNYIYDIKNLLDHLQNHLANWKQTWHKAALVKGIQVCLNEGHAFSKSKWLLNHQAKSRNLNVDEILKNLFQNQWAHPKQTFGLLSFYLIHLHLQFC